MTAPAWSAALERRAVEVCAKMEVGGDDNEEEFMDKGPPLLRCALAEIERLRGEVKRLETEITDYALTRVTGRLGPTNAEIDAADNAAGRRRARRRK